MEDFRKVISNLEKKEIKTISTAICLSVTTPCHSESGEDSLSSFYSVLQDLNAGSRSLVWHCLMLLAFLLWIIHVSICCCACKERAFKHVPFSPIIFGSSLFINYRCIKTVVFSLILYSETKSVELLWLCRTNLNNISGSLAWRNIQN